MVRATSKAAYLHLAETGKGSTKRAQILDFVHAYPGVTRNDIARHIPGMTVNCCAGRVAELLQSGDLIEDGCTKDPVTGRSVNRLYINPGDEEAVA